MNAKCQYLMDALCILFYIFGAVEWCAAKIQLFVL